MAMPIKSMPQSGKFHVGNPVYGVTSAIYMGRCPNFAANEKNAYCKTHSGKQGKTL